MEKPRIRKWLIDVRIAVAKVEKFLAGRRFDQLPPDEDMVQAAVEREIEIIGEAINRILDAEPDIEITSARQFVNVRNIVIHRYDEIDDQIIARMIRVNLPILKTEIEALLTTKYYDDDLAD